MKTENKDFHGEECWKCKTLIEEKELTKEQIDEDHEDCHGWFHCGDDCCGACSYCGE